MDVFETKGIKPMLIKNQAPAFDSSEYIYEIKLDGIRCIAYLDSNGTDLRNKRDKRLLPHVPELKDINKQVTQKCILDGELFVLKEGKTDFYEIQRRALMTDLFKIELAAAKLPASFVAYDIIYLDNKLVTELPLLERKHLLKSVVSENARISISRYIEEYGTQLFDLSKKQNLEGIVAKKKDSKYYFDKRTTDWIKCKVMNTDDCVICGYIKKRNSMTSLVVGQYDGHTLIYKGHVTLGVSLRNISPDALKEGPCPFMKIPTGNDNAVWLVPKLVCIVESMPSDKGSFRQPVFKGIRNDKLPIECQI